MKLNIVNLLAVASMISFQVNAARPGTCKCIAPELGETTHRGGNELVTFRERRAFKSVRGIVRDVNGEPLAGVLVEVLDHPEWILSNDPASPVDQHRIAACKTGPDGSFCFEDIPSGRYELRASKDGEWNPSHVYIVVNRRSSGSARVGIDVRLTLGT
jgi:hypothetical protein